MVDPSAETAARTDASGANTLLATKLYLPRLQAGFVARPRLLDQLGQALGRDLILVCAPAGFGKTALLADWARQGRWPIAWLSLDAADNDPARFWRHVVAALDPACPGIAGQLGPLFGPPSPRAFEGLVEALINELATGQDPILFVLDDYHLIEAPQVHASLGFLLEHRPLGLRLVLSSRADPPLPLARLRARGQLTELRALDMRFTLEETAALLVEAVGPDVPEDAVAALAARTEGWVAGLQLAALSLRGHGDPDSFVASFSGSHRYVLDYLTEEVLDRQPVEVRGFLLETSVLDRVSGALCDAVTGRTDSQVMLERVERANLFLVPLDEVRGWWRYHHLFAELLRARLQRQQPERIAVLHRNAAAWLEEHGLADEAIRHALAAGDTVGAARLIERHFDALFFRRGEGATVQRWLAAIPAEIASSRPRLLLARSRLALVGGRLEAEYLALARILIARDLPGLALDLLERLRAGAAAGRRAGSLIEILALQALALAARGDEAAALTALTGALTRGCPQGYLRVFADEGSPMGALLGRLIAAKRAEQGPVHNVPLAYLGSLLRCFQQLAAAPGRSAVPRLPEPLTEREREILKLLAAGKPNQQIARELVVSLATVKKHVTHVLAKLGAANRTEATARARELGLLP